MKANRSDMIPKRFWIIGAGRFGRIAFSGIVRRFPGASVTIVDRVRPAVEESAGTAIVAADGIEWLASTLGRDAPVDVIVPAIPVHVAALWAAARLSPDYDIVPLEVPDDLLTCFPNAMKTRSSQWTVSHADFFCPEDCPEPETFCTRTGLQRPELYRLLEESAPQGFLPLVLRSHQLLPGVGGLRPADLLSLPERMTANSHRPIMIATSCRCHGILDFVRLRMRPK